MHKDIWSGDCQTMTVRRVLCMSSSRRQGNRRSKSDALPKPSGRRLPLTRRRRCPNALKGIYRKSASAGRVTRPNAAVEHSHRQPTSAKREFSRLLLPVTPCQPNLPNYPAGFTSGTTVMKRGILSERQAGPRRGTKTRVGDRERLGFAGATIAASLVPVEQRFPRLNDRHLDRATAVCTDQSSAAAMSRRPNC